MDIESLEKLANLKDKGLITQEEFEIQKQKLMGYAPIINTSVTNATKSKGICWKNVLFSLCIVALIFLINSLIAVILYVNKIEISNETKIFIIMLPWALLYMFLSIKFNTKKYLRCGHPVENFGGILFLSLLALPIQYLWGYLYMTNLTYNLLQIKQGNAVLKPVKQK